MTRARPPALLACAGVLLSACSSASTPPSAAPTAAAPASPLPQDLLFTGGVAGRLVEGRNPRPRASELPAEPGLGFGPLRQTGCYGDAAGVREVSVYGPVADRLWSLRVWARTLPGRDPHVVDLPDGSLAGGYLYADDGRDSAQIRGRIRLVFDPGGRSGTVDVRTADGGTRVRGRFRC